MQLDTDWSEYSLPPQHMENETATGEDLRDFERAHVMRDPYYGIILSDVVTSDRFWRKWMGICPNDKCSSGKCRLSHVARDLKCDPGWRPSLCPHSNRLHLISSEHGTSLCVNFHGTLPLIRGKSVSCWTSKLFDSAFLKWRHERDLEPPMPEEIVSPTDVTIEVEIEDMRAPKLPATWVPILCPACHDEISIMGDDLDHYMCKRGHRFMLVPK